MIEWMETIQRGRRRKSKVLTNLVRVPVILHSPGFLWVMELVEESVHPSRFADVLRSVEVVDG